MRKFVSIVLSVLMLCSVFIGTGITASGAEITESSVSATSGDFEYTVLDDDTAKITDYIGSATEIEIPSKIEGYTVTGIGDYAFDGCESLTSITIPDSVTIIGESAFSDCYSLSSITIPDSVTTIGDYAFDGCESLTSISVDANNSVYDSRNSCNAIIETATNTLIVGCKNTVIPNSVTSIGRRAFSGCTSLTSITIPDSVTSIGRRAFSGCTSLTSITIPDSVTSIGLNAFVYTGYYNNSDNWEDMVLYIGNHLIEAKTSISGEYNIKEETKCIAEYAFSWCESLTSITIPDSVAYIGEHAFYSCSSDLIIYGYQGSYAEAFALLNYIDFVSLGESSTPITPIWKFEYEVLEDGTAEITECTGYATELEIPSVIDGYTVTSIGNDVFYGSKLTSITIPDSINYIGSGAFYNCWSLTNVYISDLKAWCEINFYALDSNPLNYASNLYLNDELVTDLVISDEVTSIGKYAFYKCTSLTSVTIGKGVTTIGYKAFMYCDSLTSVTIGKGVTTIGYEAFMYCDSLTSITIPDSVTNIWDAFLGCTGLTIYGYSDSAAESYANENNIDFVSLGESGTSDEDLALIVSFKYEVLEDGTAEITKYTGTATKVEIPSEIDGYIITSISDLAFAYSSVTSVVVPNSVTNISGAFAQARKLKSVVIGDGVTDLGISTFIYCASLNSVTFGKNVEIIGSTCFYACPSIKTLVIPDGVTIIDDGAFGCYKELNITIPNSVTYICSDAFYEGEGPGSGVDNLTIYGYTGFYAESFAENHGINFIALNSESTDNTTSTEDITAGTVTTESTETTEATESTNSAETTEPTTGATDPTETTEPTTGATDPTETTEPTTGATDPTETTEPTTGTTEPTELTEPTTGATDPTETTEPTTGTTEPTESTEPTTGTTEPTETDAVKTTIKLSKSKATLYLKGTTKVKATVENGVGKTAYKTSNKKVATVNASGKITAKKAGTATITVTNNGISETFKVTIKKPKLNATNKTLKVRKSFTLKITGKVGKAKFTSSNKKVATVNSKGKVVAKKKGSATITVKTNGITLKCKIKVKK